MAWTDFDFTSSLIPVQAHITYNTILTILYEMGGGIFREMELSYICSKISSSYISGSEIF